MTGRAFEPSFPNNHQRGLNWFVIGLLLLVIAVPALAAQSALTPVIALTSRERSWLQAHQPIRLGFKGEYPPYLITTEKDLQSGIFTDLRDELSRQLGVDIVIAEFKTFSDLLEASEKKEIDAVYAIMPSRAEKRGLLTTDIFFRSYAAVYTRQGKPVTGLDDVIGKTVAMVKDQNLVLRVLKPYLEQVTIVAANTPVDGLRLLSNGKADMYIGTTTHSFMVNQFRIGSISQAYIHKDESLPFAMGVRADRPELVALLNKGLANIGKRGVETIVARWLNIQGPEERVQLNATERAWLAAHPDITFGYTDTFEPEVIVNPDGSQRGILVDFLAELNRRLGTRIGLEIDTIPGILEKAKTKKVDGILEMHPEYADKLGLLKTAAYLTSYPAVFGRRNDSFSGPSDFAGKTVAINDKIYFSEKIARQYAGQATILKVSNSLEGLRSISKGEADLFIGASFNSYLFEKYQLFDFATKYTFFDLPSGFGMAIRPDWPELIPILNKGISSFTKYELDAFVAKWVHTPQLSERVALTLEEQAWLAEHPEIRFAFSADYPPGLIVDEDGHLSGQFKDVIDLLNQRLGSTFGITVAEIKAVREMVANKEVAGQLALTAGNGARRGLLETHVLWETYPVIFAPKDSPMKINALEDLKGKAVSTLMGSRYAEKILAPYQDKIDIVRTDTIVEAFRLVYEGKVDYMIGLSSQAFYLTKMRFLTLEPAFVMTDRPTKIVMGVRDDWPKLVEILNKGLKSITEDEWVTINDKWLGTPDVIRPQLSLTLEEKAWIDQNHKIRVRVADWPPYLIIKGNDPPQGIAIEYLKLIEERTGITFNYEVTDQPFGEFLENMKQRRGPDMTAVIVPTAEREAYLSFSQTYISSPYVIFARQQEEVLIDISVLSGKTLAVPRGFVMQQLLEKDYPEIGLVQFESDEQSLVALSSGKVDAYIGNLTVASHLIQKRGLSNLRVVAPTPYGDQVLSMGNRNDWPELTTMIDKALASITEAEKTAIRDKYVALRYEQGMNKALVVKWVLIACFGASGVVLSFVIWNRSLASRVRHRTMELENSTESLNAEIAERNRTEAALQKSRRFTDNLIETANVMIVGLDDKGTVNLFNPAAEKVTGYTLAELKGSDWFEVLVPVERYPHVHLEFSRLMDGNIPKLLQNIILTKSGEERMISWSNNEIKENDQVVGTLSFGIDTTERTRMEEALQESEEKFRYLVEQSPISIQVFSLEGRIVQVNESWKELWGISEERLPEVFEKYNVFEDNEARKLGLLPLIKRAFKGEGVTLPVIDYDASTALETMEVENAGGNKRWVRAQFYPVKDRRGVVVNVVGIEEDITSSIQAEQEIMQYQQRLKTLASQLTIAEEKERRTIAANLHDHVGHSLALARMQLNGILESDSDLERKILVKDISNIMLQALQDTRSLIFELSSPSMNEIGLGAAIAEWLEDQIEKRHGLKTEFSDTIEKAHRKTLDENVRALLFRNVRELLTNVVKHARAQKVLVYLKENANGVSVIIEDDGTGFDPEAVKTRNGKQGGFGLFSIHERMTDLGGTFDIQSAPGKGCKVVLTVPVEKENIVLNRSDGVVNGGMD